MNPYDKDLIPQPKGLANIGNTCYFNSLVQSLLSCSSFNKKTKEIGDGNLLAIAYNRILNGECTHVGELLRIIIHIRQKQKNKNTLHEHWQEDAHEGLMLMLEDIGDNIEKLFSIRHTTTLSCTNCESKRVVDDEHYEEPEIFSDFYQTDDCEFLEYLRCHKSTPADYKCDKCGKMGTTVQKKTLCRLSDIVCVTFKKYANKSQIKFPTEFTIKGKKGDLHYKLVAQIEHMGGQNGGHYVARGLRNGNVFLFNDSACSPSTFEPTANTYIIFYHLFE